MIQAELLTDTTEAHFRRMLTDANYGWQEKQNGCRLTICKQDGRLRWFNREGEKSSKAIHSHIKAALLSPPLDTFVIDGELLPNTFFVFDALVLGDEMLNNDNYEYREARYHSEFDGYSDDILAVTTARTSVQKQILWMNVQKSHGEGIVAKNMTAKYTQGRSGAHFKLKFWKTAEAVVIGPSPEDKDSVEIGMFNDKGQLQRISGCSLRNKFRLRPMQVIEVRFLYATKERHIVQPTLMSVRVDKSPAACKLSQLEPYINKNWMATQ